MEYDSQNTANYLYSGTLAYEAPKYAGGYQLGGNFGLRIMIKKKPIWLHRTMMKLCLGWEWVDTSN